MISSLEQLKIGRNSYSLPNTLIEQSTVDNFKSALVTNIADQW